MAFSDFPTIETLMLNKLKDYVGERDVSLLSALSSSKIESDCFVLAWCSSVLQCVDMWNSDGDAKDDPM
jgi:hypothetical protein